MLLSLRIFFGVIALFWVVGCSSPAVESEKRSAINVFIASDSTAADYKVFDDYQTHRYPMTGWGESFQPWISDGNLKKLSPWMHAEKATLHNHAMGGRSTRTFFEEGRWQAIYDKLQPGDFVLIQFGHNDAAVEKTERYVNIEGYKQYLRLYIDQVREKKAIPVLLTPVNRNYPWENGVLGNPHGEYPDAMKSVAAEKNVSLVDLAQRSRDFFSSKGEAYVSSTYFMNIKPGDFPAYPDGLNDNTHFQTAGAEAVSKLVYEGLLDIASSMTLEK